MENDRERLIEAFASLIAEVPFESISAKMITERAGLPASSFAYEFSDIYAAADAYLEAEVEAVKSADIHPESGGEAFILTASAAFRSPDSAKNLCRSSAAGIYRRRVSDLATKYFSELAVRRLNGAEPGDRERDAVRFLRAAAVGIATKELIAAADPAAAARRFAESFDLAADALIGE